MGTRRVNTEQQIWEKWWIYIFSGFCHHDLISSEVWNEELEKIAQRWTDQCIFDHDELRSKLDGTLVGQNAYLGKSSAEKTKEQVMEGLDIAVDAWYNEVTDPGFSPDSINPYK